MDYTIEEIRAAWVRAALAEWSRVVRDDDGGKEGNRSTIAQYFRATGWGGWLDGVTGGGYKETPRTSWCGHFAGAMGLRIGDYLEAGRCVGVQLDPDIALYCTPSTDRLASPGKWRAAGLPMPMFYRSRGDEVLRASGSDMTRAPELVLLHGVIATVKTSGHKPENGDHVVIVEEYDPVTRTVSTVEGNGRGMLGDGKQGEGVVRQERALRDVRCVYHFDLAHFEFLGSNKEAA